MHRPQILVLITLVLLILAIAVDTYGEKVKLGKAIPIEINDFPKVIGPWHDVKDLPVPEELNDVLPTAQMIERTYVNSASGGTIDLLLLTVTDYGDIHNPQACFPAQGWDLSNRRHLVVGGEPVIDMKADKDDQNLEVLFWEPDYYTVPFPKTTLAQHVYDLYIRHVRSIGNSLLVRVIGEGEPTGDSDVISFTEAIQPSLKQLHYVRSEI